MITTSFTFIPGELYYLCIEVISYYVMALELDVWPPAGIARQISISSGEQLDSSGSKQSGTILVSHNVEICPVSVDTS